MSPRSFRASLVHLPAAALVVLGGGWTQDAWAGLPEELPDPDAVLPPDYASSPVTPPPLTPPPLEPTVREIPAAPVVIKRIPAGAPKVARAVATRRPPRLSPRRRKHAVPPGGDAACLALLEHARVPFQTIGWLRGVQTPVEIVGPIGGVRLIPRAGRAPMMDCRLALVLAELAPVFRRHQVTALSFSGAYDYRTRRGSSKLSAHAHGLAIDVHALETRAGMLDVKRDFPRDGGRWYAHGSSSDSKSVAACLGRPTTRAGRTLRAVACRLKLDPALRHVLSPDTDSDHHDHLHLEAYPTGASELIAAARRSTQQARRSPRR